MELSGSQCMICLLVVVIIILLCRSNKSEALEVKKKKERAAAECKINLSIIAEELITLFKLTKYPKEIYANLRPMTHSQFSGIISERIKHFDGPDRDILISAVPRWLAISATNPLCLKENQLGYIRAAIVEKFNPSSSMQDMKKF